MTELQDVSVIYFEDCAIANGLHTLNRREHRVGVRMCCIDDNSLDSLLHSAQVQTDPY